MTQHKMKFKISYLEETNTGPVWRDVWAGRLATDAEAEARVDGLKKDTPRSLDGSERHGLYIRRGKVRWFRRFSVHARKGPK